ncbi:MAG: methyltransferase domain-containing protein [Chloroflexi bacterium]|nr:methyltransferase domain-containing protein [Chloroflexota bacterium]
MKIKPRYGHFNWMAPFYDRMLGRMHHTALIEHLQMTPGQWILDIGGGTGRVAQHLAAMPVHVIVADASPNMLDGSRRKGLSAVRSLAEQLPFASDSIDRITVVDAFHHFADQPLAAAEMVRVLRPGGRLIIEEPDLRRRMVKGIALAEKLVLMQSHFYSPPDLARLFEAQGAHHLKTITDRISALVVLSKVVPTHPPSELL